MSGIADSYKMHQDDFIEVLEENYHLFEMFANAEFTEAFMVGILIFIFHNFHLYMKLIWFNPFSSTIIHYSMLDPLAVGKEFDFK